MLGLNPNLKIAIIYPPKIPIVLPNSTKTGIQINDAIISSRHNLKKVIKVVHPKIRSKLNSFLKKNRSKKFVVLDIPLLMENKINKKKDILIFIDAKKKEINRRLKKRLNFSKVIINKLKKMQLPLEYKKRKSHFIIKNKFTKSAVKKDIKEIINFFL